MTARRAPLSPDELDRIAQLRERGLSAEAISRKVKCSAGSVDWALLKLGVDIHADKALPPVPTEEVLQRRGDHLVRRFTQAEDARLLELERSGLNTHRIAKTLSRRTNSVIGRLRTLARREARAEVQAEGHSS